MSSKQPNNQDLANIVHDGFDAIGKRFDKIEKKVETVYDYMTGQKAIADSKSGATSNKPFDDRAFEIIKWLVLIIGAILGVKFI